MALPMLFDFMSIKIRAKTCEQKCYSVICKIGYLQINERSLIDQPNNDGKPPSSRCSKSLNPLAKGLPPNCKQSTYQKNLKDLVAKDTKAAEHISVNLIAQKLASPQGTVCLAVGGSALPITPGKNSN